MIEIENFKIAVLIDGDNAESNLIEQILNETAKLGRVTIKRIYADWTTPHMKGWKEKLNKFAIRPIQKFAYTKGKNSTDSALIIDVMDIIHSKLVDGFCIVSSDSDYTGIANRIREEGLFVMGMGKAHTPEAFVKACETFIYTEILVPKKEIVAKLKKPSSKKKLNIKNTESITPKVHETIISDKVEFAHLTNKITNEPINIELIDDAFKMVVNDITGLALASRLRESLIKVDPTFDIRNYGHNSFRKFIEALKPKYELVLHDDKVTISVKQND